jgi:hypothetical protein
MNLQAMQASLSQFTDLHDFFSKFYEKLDDLDIRGKVDKDGLDRFVKECAMVSGAVGAATGLGGIATTIIGVPIELTNNIFQQFRVTLAVIYHRTGQYKPTFNEFMKIVGMSLGVEVGAILTHAILSRIATALLTRMAAKTALRAIPLLGSVVGAGTNYLFIVGIGKALNALDWERA